MNTKFDLKVEQIDQRRDSHQKGTKRTFRKLSQQESPTNDEKDDPDEDDMSQKRSRTRLTKSWDILTEKICDIINNMLLTVN